MRKKIVSPETQKQRLEIAFANLKEQNRLRAEAFKKMIEENKKKKNEKNK